MVAPYPAVRIVLDHLLCGEGYRVETWSRVCEARSRPEPALMLVSPGEEGGLCGFRVEEAASALSWLCDLGEVSVAGIRATAGACEYLPEPFGLSEVLRLVRAFDPEQHRPAARVRRPG